MFLVKLADGTALVEGREGVENWEAIPADARIVAVALTDGRQIIATLDDCDEYLICYEAVATQLVTCDEAGAVNGAAGRPTTRVCAQFAYGIKHAKPARRELSRIQHLIEAEISAAFDSVERVAANAFVFYAKGQLIQQYHDRIKRIVERLEETEVRYLALRIDSGVMPLSKLTQNQAAFRQGLSDPTNNLSPSVIREQLLPGFEQMLKEMK